VGFTVELCARSVKQVVPANAMFPTKTRAEGSLSPGPTRGAWELAERSRARAGAICEPGCTCGKHTPEEGRGQKISAAKMGVVCPSGCGCKRHYRSEETRNKIGDSNRGIKRSEEVKRKKSEALIGIKFNGEPARGFSYRDGYKILTGQRDHPLATGSNLAEHRKVLYDAIGTRTPSLPLGLRESSRLGWAGRPSA